MPLPFGAHPRFGEGQTASESLAVALVGRTVEAVHPEHTPGSLSLGLDDGNFVLLTPKTFEGLPEGFEVKVDYLPRLREARIRETALMMAAALRRDGDIGDRPEGSLPYERSAWLNAGCVYEDGPETNAERLETWARR